VKPVAGRIVAGLASVYLLAGYGAGLVPLPLAA